MSQSEQAAFLSQYMTFCANPLRGEVQLFTELRTLAALPFVVSLKFYNPFTLMVGTESVVILHNHERYAIGEFIFFIRRRRIGRVWETGFRFLNVTHPMSDDVGNNYFDCMHPHIAVEKYPAINTPTGMLCIARGQFGVYQYIRKGEIHFAVSRLWEILHMYGTGTPFSDVTNWPKLTGEEK